MKRIFLLFFVLFFSACSQKAVYNENLPLETKQNETLLQKSALIYVDEKFLGTTSKLSPITTLGNGKILSIDIYDFLVKSSKRFFENIFYSVEITTDKDLLKSADFIIKPKILDFHYGFFSSDGMDITAKTFVEYDLWIIIDKSDGKNVFIKSFPNKKYFSEERLFKPEKQSFALVAPVFQKGINSDLNGAFDEIIKALKE